MHTSSFWKNHFENNLKIERINWNIKPNITKREKSNILNSLKAWQLGETSDGSNLLKAATKYAHKNNDPEYIEAIKLFIKEEQKHGANLGKYIDSLNETRKQKDWGDTLFRKTRHINTNMEIWTITVIIVELAAQVYYQAISNATNCPLLKNICDDILKDEANHIKFQNERLHIIFNQKRFLSKTIRLALYSSLYFLTTNAVWFAHKKALKAGGINHKEFMRQMNYKFLNSLKYIHSLPKVSLPKLSSRHSAETDIC